MVSAKFLQDHVRINEANLGDPKLRILDGSWHQPFTKRSGFEEWKTQHIPGALFFDIVKCADTSDPKMVFMPPTPEKFEEYVGRLGINNDTHVVVYDNNEMLGMFSSARVWWLFRLFGHDRVSILDGGFPAWKRATKQPVNLATSLVEKVEFQPFKAQYRPELVKSYEDVVDNVKADGKLFQLISARPPGRFQGTEPEPNPALKSGHVPGAHNIPLPAIIDQKTKKMKGMEGLRTAFEGIDLSKPITAMCTGGVSSSFIVFALHLLRVPNDVAIYEGSWPEWQRRADDTMIATGPA